VLVRVGIEGWALGRNKIMLKFHHASELEAHSVAILQHVTTMQRCELCIATLLWK
jgi:hypothetical protein